MVIVNKTLPVFDDESLTEPGSLHDSKCRAAVLESGRKPSKRCRCNVGSNVIPRGTKGALLRHNIGAPHNFSALVKFGTFAPIWVEAAPLMTILTASASPEEVKKYDFKTWRSWKLKNLGRKDEKGIRKTNLPRRRRPIKGGELVLIRSEKNLLSSYRFIMTYQKHQTKMNPTYAMLLSPEATREEALTPDWTQVRSVLIHEGKAPNSVLYPCFPLPDGTEDPGWAMDFISQE